METKEEELNLPIGFLRSFLNGKAIITESVLSLAE
jgi:hypothetical protein